MKIKYSLLFVFSFLFLGLAFFSPSMIVYAQNENSYVVKNDDEMLNQDYLDFYSIPTSFFSFTNNGGVYSGSSLSYAFDRDYNTFFRSKAKNNLDYTPDGSEETISNFANTIDVTFSSAVTLDKILYSSETNMTRGYPTNLNLYYDNGDSFVLINNYQTTETTSFVAFEFGKSIKMTKFRFEYIKVSTHHDYTATAREIIFLQPENENFELYKNIFTDYNETTLNEKLNTIEKINAFENILKMNVNFSSQQNKIDRAKKVANGELIFNQNLEFSTNPSAKKVIERNGDLANYCRSTLRFASFGSNRQPIGVLGMAGNKITIYVTGDKNDPLPKIVFTQHIGSWQSWKSGEYSLSLGKNVFTVPSFYHADSYNADVPLGGPIYICNPYTSSEQSENVKLYIEGGTLYPVFSKNVSEEEYKIELQKYVNYVQTDPDNIVDVTEIISDHIFLTVRATNANQIFSTLSPSESIQNWNEYLDKLLDFCGVYQDKTNELFDERNLLIKTNIRVDQTWSGGFMFAAGEHIGIQNGSQNVLIYPTEFGWGTTHELGHSMDIPSQLVSETSNNVWSKFYETAIANIGERGEFDYTLKTLSNDLTYNSSPYFTTKKFNYLIWWYIETWQKGFWANLENCYRETYPILKDFLSNNPDMKNKISALAKTELQVFYASLVTKVDLSYYYERWGFSIDNTTADPVFKTSTATENFNNIMSVAISQGYIDNSKQYKLWYQNNKAYNSQSKQTFDETTSVSIDKVIKSNSGYCIIINGINDDNLLGYEIWEGNDADGYHVIGFSYYKTFTDETEYEDSYIPTYKVVAFDKAYSQTMMSEAKTLSSTSSEIVCKIGETEYSSLSSAINNANAGDTILLLKSIETINVVISKNLTITLADNIDKDIVISKIESGNLFTISSGVTLNLLGNQNYNIVLDGNNFSQNGSLLNIGGKVNLEYVKLINNFSANSGVISMQDKSKGSTIKNCIIENNKAKNGSAYCCLYADSNMTFINTTFLNNVSTSDGVILSKGTLTLTDCEIKNNSATNGTIKNYDGGILRASGCTISNNTSQIGGGLYIDGYTDISNTLISNNTATIKAGGIYYSTSVAVRKLILTNVEFLNNNSEIGNDIMVDGSLATLSLNSVTTHSFSQIYIASGTVQIKNDCNLQTNFTINLGANLSLSNGLFENIENSNFAIENFKIGMKIISFSNYTLSNDELAKFKIANENINFEINENAIYAYPIKVYLALKFENEEKVLIYDYKQNILLNFDIPVSKYINKITDKNGNEYTLNQLVTMENNLSLNISLLDKIKIELVYKDRTEKIYLLPNEKYVLPNYQKEDIIFLNWKNASQTFDAGNEILATENITFVAEYIQLYKLILKKDDKIVFEKYYADGSEIDLSEIDVEKPDFWILDNEKIDNKFVINCDTVLTFGYSSLSTIIIISSITLGATITSLCVGLVIKKRKQNKFRKEN